MRRRIRRLIGGVPVGLKSTLTARTAGQDLLEQLVDVVRPVGPRGAARAEAQVGMLADPRQFAGDLIGRQDEIDAAAVWPRFEACPGASPTSRPGRR